MENYKEFIEYEKGTIPIILSVPHGGTIDPQIIPKRLSGIMGIDKGTIQLTRELANFLKKYIEKKNAIPSYVISKIRRSKIDLNRVKNESYNSNSAIATKIYTLYHMKIKEFVYMNLKKFNYSLLIDIHGFEKYKRPQGFRDVEIVLGTNNLNSLFPEPVPKKDWDKNIRGKLIKRFLELNIPIAPGHTKRKEYVLSGGFIIQEYGASKIKRSQTVQTEFSDKIRMQDDKLKIKVLKALSEVLVNHILLEII